MPLLPRPDGVDVIKEAMSGAHVVIRDDDQGPVSRPDLAAGLAREITAPPRVPR